MTSKIKLTLLVGLLILVFIFNNNLIRKFYNILTITYHTRLAKSSGNCSRDSIGYLKYLKKKYNFTFNPRVINFENASPSSNWAVYNNNFEDKDEHIILLNYTKESFLYFEPLGRIFISNKNAHYQSGILEILFNLKQNKINFDSEILIYRKKEAAIDDKEIIYKGYFNQAIFKNVPVPIKYKTEKINNFYKPIYLEMPGLTEKQILKINSITLNLEHKFDLKNLKIIDNYKNCYYVYE